MTVNGSRAEVSTEPGKRPQPRIADLRAEPLAAKEMQHRLYPDRAPPLGIVVAANGEGWESPGNSALLGVTPDAESEGLSVGPVEAGDLVALFTDGLTGSRAPSDGFFGPRRVVSTVAHSGGASAGVICEQVLAAADTGRAAPARGRHDVRRR
jgi:hypothetical protein